MNETRFHLYLRSGNGYAMPKMQHMSALVEAGFPYFVADVAPK
jgi:hypothetical protein